MTWRCCDEEFVTVVRRVSKWGTKSHITSQSREHLCLSSCELQCVQGGFFKAMVSSEIDSLMRIVRRVSTSLCDTNTFPHRFASRITALPKSPPESNWNSTVASLKTSSMLVLKCCYKAVYVLTLLYASHDNVKKRKRQMKIVDLGLPSYGMCLHRLAYIPPRRCQSRD